MKTKKYIQETSKYMDKLNEENSEKFDEILFRIRFSKVNDNEAEEFIYHCLDVFLEAQNKEISVEEALGINNIDEFCNDFINETKKNYSLFEKVYYKLQYLPLMIIIFTGIWQMLFGKLIKIWIKDGFTFEVPITLSMVVNLILVMFAIDVIFNKMYSICKWIDGKTNWKSFIVLWIFFTILMGIFVLSELFLNIVIINVNYLVFMGIFIAILIIQHFYENNKSKDIGRA
ncbi:MAG: hypothetical protein GX275_11480 [Clostridiales bacterium]|nr:hypothetical protein [Clostridiales bacterium]